VKTDRKALIYQVFSDVISRYAFMFAEPMDEKSADDLTDQMVLTEIMFEGPHNGKIKLLLPIKMCHEIATNILGETDDGDNTCDAAKELVNIMCGNVLTALYGDVIFNISSPQNRLANEQDKQEICADNKSVGFLVDDYMVLSILDVFGETE
jgi:chemotaxis protein CheY-P-specific phosphatase CheC